MTMSSPRCGIGKGQTMGYVLGKRSLQKLGTVDDRQQRIVFHAISVTKQDFSVICGIRSHAEQKKLVSSGASQTMKSKHLEGLAVDLMAYNNGGRWELNLYDEIADAMAQGALHERVPIRWGAAWHIDDIGDCDLNAEGAMNQYIDLRRSQGRRPFIDAPHFEIVQ
jgi:peptidoglycan L-alanyl-D-glutamate endopeptidase CwlK